MQNVDSCLRRNDSPRQCRGLTGIEARGGVEFFPRVQTSTVGTSCTPYTANYGIDAWRFS